MMSTKRVLIVGGVAAGMSVATRLRRNLESAEIVVLERGGHVSFANCGLPYYLSGDISDRNELLLNSPDAIRQRFAIDVRVQNDVLSIDRESKTVTVLDRSTRSIYDAPYDALVLATGAAPVVPPISGVDHAMTLRSIEDVDRVYVALTDRDVRSAVVVGGGFVGLEVAESLHKRGLAVTIVEAGPALLSPLDSEMSAMVLNKLRAEGIAVELSAEVSAISAKDVTLGQARRIASELTILAVGVRPESAIAREAGLAIGVGGGVVVDKQMRTSDPAIFAVGDVAVKQDHVSAESVLVPLAQTANRHGRLVADVIAGKNVAAPAVLGTAIIGLFDLQIGATGWNERKLQAAHRRYRAIHTHPANHATYYPGAQQMSLKLLVDPDTDLILGAQGIGGSGVDKRIDVIAVAMRAGLTASSLADVELAYAPQFGSAKDPINMLGMIAENHRDGLSSSVQWHELQAEVGAGAYVIDVRSPTEHRAGAIPGAINIPLDQLRARAAEIPRTRVVVHCAVGQRGHTAARLLRQLGWDDVKNLDGGYRTWINGSGVVEETN